MKWDSSTEYPPSAVKHAAMYQAWSRLTFLHWRYSPDAIAPLLPRDLELDTFDGSAWVGLTPFRVVGLRPPGFPPLPWVSQFPEMNVRTYVRGPDGEHGIWFFSLEADRLAAVLGARASYRLPYRWARMRIRDRGNSIEYESRRHIGAGHARIGVRLGEFIRLGERERFLTARYRLYTMIGERLAYAQVEHPPWPLQSAELLHLEQNVIVCSLVPPATGDPLVHFSPGVWVRIGPPVLTC